MNIINKLFVVFIAVFLFGCTAPVLKGVVKPTNPYVVPSVAVVSENLLADALATELLYMGFTVIERNKLAKILDEQSLSLSGVLDDSKIIEVGRILNVDVLILVSGRYDAYITDRIANAAVKIVDVETGRLIGSFSYQNGKGGTPGSPADHDQKETIIETAARIATEIGKAYRF
jgi:hypothetical protein